MWLVVILTGFGIGLTGGWLDVLVKWYVVFHFGSDVEPTVAPYRLGDLREGRCSYGFFYNQVACCSGVNSGEACTEWRTWSEFLGVRVVLAQSLLHTFVYVALAVSIYLFPIQTILSLFQGCFRRERRSPREKLRTIRVPYRK